MSSRIIVYNLFINSFIIICSGQLINQNDNIISPFNTPSILSSSSSSVNASKNPFKFSPIALKVLKSHSLASQQRLSTKSSTSSTVLILNSSALIALIAIKMGLILFNTLAKMSLINDNMKPTKLGFNHINDYNIRWLNGYHWSLYNKDIGCLNRLACQEPYYAKAYYTTTKNCNQRLKTFYRYLPMHQYYSDNLLLLLKNIYLRNRKGTACQIYRCNYRL